MYLVDFGTERGIDWVSKEQVHEHCGPAWYKVHSVEVKKTGEVIVVMLI